MSLEKESEGYEAHVDSLSDDALALAAKGGDRGARNTLYLRHLPSIKPMLTPAKRILTALAYFDSSLQPDDLTQQAFLIFCHLLDRWPGDPSQEPLLSYVARLLPSHAAHFVRDTLHARTKAWSHHLEQGDLAVRRNKSELKGTPSLGPAIRRSPRGTPHDDPLNEQLHTNIAWHERIDDLDHQTQSLLTLRYSLGLSTAQIADLSSFSPRTIDRQLSAALQQFRHQLLSTWQDCVGVPEGT